MKKNLTIFCLTLFTAFMLTGCQDGMESDANKMANLGCQFMEMLNTAQTDPSKIDTDKAEKVQKDIEKLQDDLKDKYSEEDYQKLGDMAQEKMQKNCGDYLIK